MPSPAILSLYSFFFLLVQDFHICVQLQFLLLIFFGISFCPYLQFSSGGIIRLPKFEMTMTKAETNQKPVLTEDDVHIVTMSSSLKFYTNYENFQYGLHFPQKILIYILLLSTGMEEYTACNLIGLACYSTCIGSIEMLLCNRYKFLLKHSLILVSNSKVFFSKLFYAVRKSVPSFPPLYYPAILAFLYTVLGTHRP